MAIDGGGCAINKHGRVFDVDIKPDTTEVDELSRQIDSAMSLRQDRRRKAVFNTVVFLFVVVAITTLIAINLFFKVEQINVAGITKYSSEDIVKSSGIELNSNIFSIDINKIEQQLYDKYPYIAKVYIRRLLPDKLEIVVTEGQQSLVVLNSNDSYSIVGDSSRVLEHGTGPYLGARPIVVGLNLSNLPLGYTIEENKLYSLELKLSEEKILDKKLLAFRVSKALTEAGFDKVSYIDVSDGQSFKFLFDNRILVNFGTELDIEYRLKFLQEVLTRLGNAYHGVVDMSVFPTNSKVYTRQQSIYDVIDKTYKNMYM